MARKGKNRFTSSPNILRSVPKTDKEEGLRREEGRNRPVCSLVRRSSFVRGDMVASSVDPASSRGRAEVPVWWNGSRVIEILCSLPSRYDVCGGLIPYRLFLSFSLLAFSPSLSSPPLSYYSRYLLLRILLLLILSKRYPDSFTCHVRGTRTRAGRAQS